MLSNTGNETQLKASSEHLVYPKCDRIFFPKITCITSFNSFENGVQMGKFFFNEIVKNDATY